LSCERGHDLILGCPRCSGFACAVCGLCEACGGRLAGDGRILRLLGENHPFYEGVYQAQTHFPESALGTLRGRILLPFITYGYLQDIVRYVPKGGKLLELGCGSGLQLAATRYEVTAVELSLASLRGTPEGYRHRIQADAMALEFRPGTFDAIAASCFWEHIAPELKGALLEKFVRWLRPGGALILLFDTESQNPCFRWFRRQPQLYQRCFIDNDGHVGLETATVNLARFARQGFAKVAGVGLNRTLQHLPFYTWIAPYGETRWWIRSASGLGMWLDKRPRLSQAFTGSLHLWDLTAGRLFPQDWSRLYLGVWMKAGENRRRVVPPEEDLYS
jgi:SAM-dependent methyltransferase